jgi:prepilin-type N-terminal cleavage/methylation domain-containing protein
MTKTILPKNNFSKLKSGFTIIELLVVIGLFGLLASFVVVNLMRPMTKASVDSSLSTLISDLRQQQIKSMVGSSDGLSSAQYFGIYFSGSSYTLFHGTDYSAGDETNFVVNLDVNLNLSTTFPGNQVVFSRRSGEITGFVNGSNVITVTNTADGETSSFSLNQLGAPIIP